jgi:hypothetical protein
MQTSVLVFSCVWVVPIFMFALANKMALEELVADIESPHEDQLETSSDYWEGMSSPSKLIQSFGQGSPLGRIQSLFKSAEKGSIPRYTRRSSRKGSCHRNSAVVRH